MQHRHPARSGLSLVLAALVLGPSAGAASGGEASSGPPVGGKTRPFTVQDVTGQAKGGRICYVWANKGRPSFVVFTRTLDDRLTRLVKAIDKFVAEHKKDQMKGFVVLLDENSEENRKKLAAYALKHELMIPHTIAVEGKRGPGAYKLNPDVPITILAAKRDRVKQRFALVDPAPSDQKAQAKEVEAILAAGQALLK